MTKAGALASERLSVLVVEDNPADADLVREMLRDANLVASGAITPEIHHVGTLSGALAAAKDRFDVALLDLGLPDATGLDGLSALSAAVPDLPAVVLTGARDPALAARALVAGAEDFLVKGEVEGELLLRSLRFAVARHRRRARQRLSAPNAPSDAGASAGAQAERSARHDASVRRVLLIEDNPGDADLVRIALSEGPVGFAVHHVERLGDALAWLSSGEVDAVLLDLGLPDAAGMQCVDRIRAAVPELPVIVLTGNSGAAFEAARSGVQDYVVKGEFAAKDLQRAIHYAIERNAHSRRARELAAERAAHAATQARQHEIEALFAGMIDPVLVWGEDRHIEATNPAATKFFGVDVRGLSPAGFIEAAHLRFAAGPTMTVESLPGSRALDGATVSSERLRARTSAGERVVLVSASPLRRGDTVRGAVAVWRDVTELDRAEHVLRESDERKNQFLAMLSHELRNPLAPIRNSVYILERASPGGDQARRACSVIDRQVQHLTRLVDDLLDVTRISHGKIRVRCERVDLSVVAHQAAEDHRSVFSQNGVHLETSVAAAPLYVSGDSTRIAQVIGNLLHNAAKFTPRGGRVALSVGRAGEELAAIRVHDNGEGIAPEALRHVFEPFVQMGRALDRTHGGLGLGLALVKALAELHGGTATAHSDGLGKGAEFVVTLPLDRAEPRPTEGDARAVTPPARRILVIEDNVDAAESLREVLELSDHVVEIAGSGPEGLAKAHAFGPDVVLCDIGLPTMDGFEVASAMRADPALRSIALVALSGYAAPADLERATAAGFDRHLAKPVDLDELERVMSEVAGLHSERSARARTRRRK